jgi:asparagine synthase (glutamine-hydrolysing)
MCGIVGFSGQFTQTQLVSGLASVAHRGPDDSGWFIDDKLEVGLAHSRLSIIDLSTTGHQPMESANGRVVLVFNGEIYNYVQLRDVLEDEGYAFRGKSDTEVLLNLYLSKAKTNEDLCAMLRDLNGIFAFALWDSSAGAILLARDALGVKPIYYVVTKDGVAFASEIKALLPLLNDRCETESNRFHNLDAASINRYLSFLWCPGEGTPRRSVRKLGPGEAIWLKSGRIIHRLTWYQLPIFRRQEFYCSKKEVIKGTIKHLRQAVQRQMVADVPVGAFLSGGLDSSSLVAFAREINPDIRCFSIMTDHSSQDGFADDLPYARRVADHLRVQLEVVRVNAEQMANDLPMMVAQLDEPLADPAPLNIMYITRLARASGIKVLLSGAGGDDLFSGYRRHRALMMEGVWSWLPSRSKMALKSWSSRMDQRRPLFRRMRKLFSGAVLVGEKRLVEYFRWIDQADLAALYTPEFMSELSGSNGDETLMEFLSMLPSEANDMERMLSIEQRFFLADHNLNYTDKMSMVSGVEVRVPFLDLDLVEFAARIPVRFKQRFFHGKWVLKKAMEPYLPRDVIYRPKSGFGVPLRRWIRFDLKDLIAEVLGPISLRRRGIFDPKSVQRLIESNDRGDIDASYTIFSLICIEIWCREFIDKPIETKGRLVDKITKAR